MSSLASQLRRSGRGRFRELLVDHCVASMEFRKHGDAERYAALGMALMNLADWLQTACFVMSSKTVDVTAGKLQDAVARPALAKPWLEAIAHEKSSYHRDLFVRAATELLVTYGAFLSELCDRTDPKTERFENVAEICLHAAVNLADCLDLNAPVVFR